MSGTYLFINVGSYPIGNASTNRALSYMRGLVEIGNDVTLFVLAPDNSNQSKSSNLKEVVYKGVRIKYKCPLLFVNHSILSHVNYFIGIINGLFSLMSILLKYRNQVSIVLLIVNPIVIFLFMIPIKIFRAKVFHERTEYPFLGKKGYRMNQFYNKIVIPQFDGIYVISTNLVQFFNKLTEKPILHLPMTVEYDRFNFEVKKSKIKYAAYCGSMYTDKDGVPDLIESFNMFSKENKEIFLYLIGDNSDKKKFKIISDKIDISPVKHRIICTGNVERDKMPELLKNAIMLLLCRPDNLQAQGGFPTKLGEYLATANPVVITDVGDHGRYLKDRVSAFIARPGDPYSFASKMLECLNDPVLAESVGKNGYEVAMQHFNYKTQAVILSNFFEGNL